MEAAVEHVKLRGWQHGDMIKIRARSPIYKGVYECRVLGLDEDSVRISVPMKDGKLVLIPVGTSVEVAKEGEGWLSAAVVDRRGGSDRCLVLGDSRHAARDEPSVGTERDTRRVIAVTSGKGGVGKTTVVVNLGIALSRLGKRVCVIDADLGTANVDVLLNLTPRYTLADVISGERSIFEVLVEGPDSLVVLPGGSGLQELTQLDARQFARLIGQFRELETYTDVILIDTGSGLSTSVTNFLVAAGEALVVTTPEPPAITDAYALIKVLARQGAQVGLKLIVNRVASGREATEITQKMVFATRRFLNYDLKPLGFVLEDAAVGRAVREQVAVVAQSPRARVSENISELAARLAGEPVAAPVGTTFVGKLRELFPRRR